MSAINSLLYWLLTDAFSNGVDPPGAAGVELVGLAGEPGVVVDRALGVVDAAVAVGDRMAERAPVPSNHAAAGPDVASNRCQLLSG